MSAETSEANKALVRELFACVDRGDLEGLLELVAEDIVIHTPVPGVENGREGFRAFMQGFFSAFPEQSVEIHDLIADDDQVVARHTHHATHGGEFLGAPPTGRTAQVDGIEIFRIQDGKVIEFWHNDDLLSLIQQLGLIPSPEGIPA
jgi:steroid delta-isomerase-like uncharacterized protein